MTVTVLLLAAFLFSGIVSFVLSGIGKKLLLKILNIPICTGISLGVFFCGLYLYARVSHIALTIDGIFPDRMSALVGGIVYFIISVVAAIAVGALENGGIKKYMRRLYKARFFKAGVLGFLCAIAVVCLAGVLVVQDSSNRISVVINEVCPHNFNLCCDKNKNYSDYIELYNAGDSAVQLSELYLSDSASERDKFNLPKYLLGPGEYVLVWADGSKTPFFNEEIHANFRLSDNETVVLTRSNGQSLDSAVVGAMPYNVSLSRVGDTFAEAYGTPLKSNEGCELYRAPTLASPVFSIESGFYKEDIVLEISAPAKSTVYYTTDGSLPDETSKKYDGAITLTDVSHMADKYVDIKNTVQDYDDAETDDATVEKANVIRAVAVDGKGRVSEVVTGTYFVGEAAAQYDGYAIFSIVADPDDLFGNEGICVTGDEYDEWYTNTDRSGVAPTPNFWKMGREWEREAVIQLWDADHSALLDQTAGIRVQGNTSRSYAIKRFSFFARNAYSGSPYFDSPLFEEKSTHSFYVRHDDYDAVIHELLKGRNSISVLRAVPTVMFLDGEYYTKTFLREKYDDYYFEEYYGVSQDDLIVISDSASESGNAEHLALYKNFVNFIEKSDASDPQVYEEICSLMDVQSFIDFMCTNLYMNNIDWSLYKNLIVWRSGVSDGEGYNDGKWRFCIYDMDAVGWAGDKVGVDNAKIDPFEVNLPYTDNGTGDFKLTYLEAPIFSTLIENPQFKEQFILTYFDLMNVEFSPENIEIALSALGLDENSVWKGFYVDRPEYATQNIVSAMELSGELCNMEVTADEGGAVCVNTLEKAEVFNGVYPIEYAVTLTAVPEEGYRFVRWEGDAAGSDSTVSVRLLGKNAVIKAVFEKTEEGN